MPVAPTPLLLASSANCCFQASKPPGPLPHCAALAFAPSDVNIASAANVAVANCLPLVIQNSLQNSWRRPRLVPHVILLQRAIPPGITASPNLHNFRLVPARTHDIAHAPAQKAAGQRRDIGNRALGGIGLILADDPIRLATAVISFDGDRVAELHDLGVRPRRANLRRGAPGVPIAPVASGAR